ncbi:MAG: NeuD/PglB/VioB family sugar acetyltransferase, partial [bacterium]|nr:NeuD/PglB/VioB family sugar acetyltransferase [bacterium]
AKVVIDAMKGGESAIPYAVLDVDALLWGKEILGVPIRGGNDHIEMLKKEGVTHFVAGIGGVRDNSPRKKLFEWGMQQGLLPLTLYHPSAVVSSHSHIGSGSVLLARSVVNPGVVIGDNCIINTGALIDHDCIIGHHIHIAPGVTLSGGVKIGTSAHIGAGAVIIQGVSVGEDAVVAAGAVVVRDVPPRVVVKGVPAK